MRTNTIRQRFRGVHQRDLFGQGRR
jgi:hypothetical protein